MKRTLTYTFGVIGAISWTITLFLRGQCIDSSLFNFILGIIPNIAAIWVILALFEQIFMQINFEFSFKKAVHISIITLLLALISEFIHDIYLNSPFDVNDIIATILSAIIYLIFFYLKTVKNNNFVK